MRSFSYSTTPLQLLGFATDLKVAAASLLSASVVGRVTLLSGSEFVRMNGRMAHPAFISAGSLGPSLILV